MAVSKSTIVFALVTCVPFGFAIHDLLGEKSGKHAHADRGDDSYEDHDESDDEAEVARAEAMQRASEARAEAQRRETEVIEKVARTNKLQTIFGAEPAALGPALGGVTLGSGSNIEAMRARVRALDIGAELEVFGDTALEGLALRLTTTPTHGPGCGDLDENLERYWSTGVIGARGSYWINPALSQRAALTTFSTVCELRIERYVAPAAWIDRGKTAVVPVWAVGRPSKELLAHLDARGSVAGLDRDGTPDQISWTDTGLGPSGNGPTRLTASLAGGRVVAVAANVDAESETSEAVATHMVKVFGAYTEDATVVWKHSKPPLEAEVTGGRFYVTAGKLPE